MICIMADPNAVKRAKKYAARRAELLLKFLSTKAAIDEANAETIATTNNINQNGDARLLLFLAS